jgi:sulfate transport system ATP-binding protein
VAILDRGRIGQVGAPADIYEQPASPSIAAYRRDQPHPRHRGRAGPAGGRAGGPLPEHAGGMAGEAEVFIRPEDVQIDGDAPGWEAVVVSGRQTGARHLRARFAGNRR